MHGFPVVCWHHLDRIPRTAIEKSPVRTFAGALLTADAQVRINFDTAERRMIFVRHPEHACFDRTILDTCRRPGAAGATIGRDRKDARALLARGLSIAFRHRPVFDYDVEHPLLSLVITGVDRPSTLT